MLLRVMIWMLIYHLGLDGPHSFGNSLGPTEMDRTWPKGLTKAYSNMWTPWTSKEDKKREFNRVSCFHRFHNDISFPTLQVVVNISLVDSVAMVISEL